MRPTHASVCSRLIPDSTPKPTAARLYMSDKSESTPSRAWFQVFPVGLLKGLSDGLSRFRTRPGETDRRLVIAWSTSSESNP